MENDESSKWLYDCKGQVLCVLVSQNFSQTRKDKNSRSNAQAPLVIANRTQYNKIAAWNIHTSVVLFSQQDSNKVFRWHKIDTGT